MRRNIQGYFLLTMSLMLTGCLSEPKGFTCIDGSPLRMADDKWYCDSAFPVTPIPVTDNNHVIDGGDSNSGIAQQPWRTFINSAVIARAGET